MRKLDRYVLRNFLEPFFLCFLAFLGIVLIFDLNDNLGDFMEAKARWKQIGAYYLHQLPRFVLLSMPLGLLLAMLFSLSRMSRSNEIISMLTAGQSVVRIIAPLIGCGLLASAFCMWLNYELAPSADAVREADIKRISHGEKRAAQRNDIDGHVFKDRLNNRVWFVRHMRLGEKQKLRVAGTVTEITAEGIVLQTKKYPEPLHFFRRAETAYVDETGKAIEATRIQPGTVVLISYAKDEKNLICRKVILDSDEKRAEKLDDVTNRQTGEDTRLSDSILEDVHISQLDAEGNVVTRWYAQGANYSARTKVWALNSGRKVNFDTAGNIVGDVEEWPNESRNITTWSETPWRIASSTMIAENLTVPQLQDYLKYNSDFKEVRLAPYRTHLQHRFALPFTCFAVIFMAAPLGIVMSRRAVLASVGSSIFLFFIYLFLMFLFLALGKGGHLHPIIAGWFPPLLLLGVGGYLLFLKHTNREFPKPSFLSK